MDIEEKALEEHNLNLQNGYLQEMEKSQIKSQDSGKYYRSNIVVREIFFLFWPSHRLLKDLSGVLNIIYE